MAKLTSKEREVFESIISEDLRAVHRLFRKQLSVFWDKARQEIIKRRGFDLLMKQKQKLREEIRALDKRMNEIEDKMRSEPLSPEQVVELGGGPDPYGHYSGANFYGIPVNNQFDYDVVQHILERIDLEVPAKFISDLARSCLRELAMCGTFEEARAAYEEFYSLDFREYGVDIPPRLVEFKEIKASMESAQLPLFEDEPKLIENKV